MQKLKIFNNRFLFLLFILANNKSICFKMQENISISRHDKLTSFYRQLTLSIYYIDINFIYKKKHKQPKSKYLLTLNCTMIAN